MNKPRSWISPTGYRELATKYGTVMVSFTGSGYCNVEVREPIEVAGGQFRGVFTITSEKSPYGSIVGKVTYWHGALTARREKLLLDEVLIKVREAADGSMSQLIKEADRREVNNDIIRAEDDLRAALQTVAEAKNKLLALLAHEGSLLGEESTSDLLAS